MVCKALDGVTPNKDMLVPGGTCGGSISQLYFPAGLVAGTLVQLQKVFSTIKWIHEGSDQIPNLFGSVHDLFLDLIGFVICRCGLCAFHMCLSPVSGLRHQFRCMTDLQCTG